MDSPGEILRLCRLCLVKDQVNIPIFEEEGDSREIFLKISSCLPVKVSREDRLPKKICDGCSEKLNSFYEFWSSSANAEKTLLSWVGEEDVEEKTEPAVSKSLAASATLVKEESEPVDEAHAESIEESTKDEADEAPPAKRARRSAAVKAQINLAPDSEDDDLDMGEPLTKTEEESAESDGEDKDPSYTDMPGTSADDEQAGPSGMGKDGVEAPYETKYNKRSLTRRKTINYTVDSKPDNHLRKTRKRTWQCKKCLKVLPNCASLQQHRKIHIRTESPVEQHTYRLDAIQDLYICNTCSAEFQLENEVKQHLEDLHGNEHGCRECGLNFNSMQEMGVHSSVHHPEGHFSCPVCPYKSAKRGTLLVHINYVHLNKFAYFCSSCGRGFNDHSLYKEHGNEHLGIKPFRCVVCDKNFAYTRYLYTHQIRTHRVTIDGQILPNQCLYCNRKYSKPETLEKHVDEVHRKMGPHAKKHLCDTCGKGFAQHSKLTMHKRVHTGYKPYSCQYCQKCFTKKDYLVMHERVHSGEKPYSCEYCGKCFSQGAPLRIHQRIHTGEKPYECSVCLLRFSSRGAFNLHKNCKVSNPN